MTAQKTTRRDIKAELVQLVLDHMKKTNRAPWDKGLCFELSPINVTTNKEYRGINRILLNMLGLDTMEFATFKQVQDAKGRVKKGAKGLPIVYWDFTIWNSKEERKAKPGDDEKDLKRIPFLKKYTVFNICDCEGIESNRKNLPTGKDNKRIDDAQDAIDKFIAATGVKFVEKTTGTACYSPSEHAVYIAKLSSYKSSEHYYSTLFHELIHSTNHEIKRTLGGKFGSHAYSEEEIVAEFGAMLLCSYFGIEKQTENSAEYLTSWGRVLKANPNWLIKGANEAEKAVEYFLKKVAEYRESTAA